MSSLFAFIKKEFLAQMRSAKLIILGAVFVFFGVMNPIIAKSTPWLLELMSDALAETGMNITIESVTALDSWAQFFKKIPMVFIAFVVLQSNIFTKEYRSGTLVLSLTKGLDRFKVVISKTLVLILLWTVAYFIYFGSTYLPTVCFWDNGIAKNLAFSTFCWWIFGVFTLSLIVLFSTILSSNIGVLGCTGGVTFGFSMLAFLPKIHKYFPTFLMDGTSLVYGFAEPKAYLASMVITIVLTIICFVVSVPLFNKKQL